MLPLQIITRFSGFQAFLSAQSTPLGESLGRSNQRGSKTSNQACYGHPRCNLNLVGLFRFSLFVCRCLDAFSSSFTHAAINLQPPSRTVLYIRPQGQVQRCFSVPRDAKYPTILCHAVRPFFFLYPPRPTFSRVLQLSRYDPHHAEQRPRPQQPLRAHGCFRSLSSPDMTMTLCLDNLWSPMRSSAPDHNNLLVRTAISMLSHSVRWMVSL